MMRMTWASFMQVLKKMLIRALYGAYIIMAERKDATATITETVPRQRSGFENSIEMPVEKNKCDGSVSCEERWGAPGYRVPMCRRHGNEEEQLRFTSEYNNQPCISYNTSIQSIGVVSGLYLRNVQRERFSFVEGSRRSRDGGSGSSRSRSFGEVLDDSNVFGATVVVHGPRDVDHSGSDLRVLST